MSADREGEQTTEDAPRTAAPGVRDSILMPGVRLAGAPANTTLTTPLGTVVAEEPWDTYIVHLDTPAIYHNDDGTEHRLGEIRVLRFNLTPII